MRSLLHIDQPTSIDVLRREMDHLFDEMIPFSWKRSNGEKVANWTPNADLVEEDSAFHLRVDLPGLTKKDIKVNYQDGRLTISGEREKEKEEETRDYIRRERSYGSFFKSLTLPAEIKEEQIKANFKDGVLDVTLPKVEPKKAKAVHIE